MTVNEFLKATIPENIDYYGEAYVRPRAICADGFTLSIQANAYAYCTPRRIDADKYSDVEVGLVSFPEPKILDWAEDRSVPTETIYPFIPVDLLDKVLLEEHGGIVGYVDITNERRIFANS